MKNKIIISFTVSILIFKSIKECYFNNNLDNTELKEISTQPDNTELKEISTQTDNTELKEISTQTDENDLYDNNKFIIINN